MCTEVYAVTYNQYYRKVEKPSNALDNVYFCEDCNFELDIEFHFREAEQIYRDFLKMDSEHEFLLRENLPSYDDWGEGGGDEFNEEAIIEDLGKQMNLV